MTKVYLDNNVIVDIEYGNLNLSDFLSLQNVKYFFSPSHIEELFEGEKIQSLSIINRLNLIEKLTSTNYIKPNIPEPCFSLMSPQQIYMIEKNPIVKGIRNRLNSHADFNVDREEFLKILKLKKIEINNNPPNVILGTINEVMSQTIKMDINTYLKLTDAYGRALFATLFNLLDFVCFYKDKQTNHSDIARMYDASHAYYAQICDIIVTQDKRNKFKTEAVYSYLNINTKVLTVKDFLGISECK